MHSCGHSSNTSETEYRHIRLLPGCVIHTHMAAAASLTAVTCIVTTTIKHVRWLLIKSFAPDCCKITTQTSVLWLLYYTLTGCVYPAKQSPRVLEAETTSGHTGHAVYRDSGNHETIKTSLSWLRHWKPSGPSFPPILSLLSANNRRLQGHQLLVSSDKSSQRQHIYAYTCGCDEYFTLTETVTALITQKPGALCLPMVETVDRLSNSL